MNKGLKVSLVYLLIGLASMGLNRVMLLFFEPNSIETAVVINIFAYLISLVGLVYLLVMLSRKIPEYPMLKVYIGILVANSFVQFVVFTVGYYVFFLYPFILLFHVLMFFFSLVFAIVMLVNKGWPKIVSFVLFASLPSYLLNIGGNTLVRLFYDWLDTFVVFSYIGFASGFLLLLLTTIMLYVLYYEKERVKSFAQEEGY